MPARFVAKHSFGAGTNTTLIELGNSAGARRAWINELRIGTDSTPDDKSGRFEVIRGTVMGSGVGLAETKLDPTEGASDMTAVGGLITAQTKTANSTMLGIPLYQRATFRWLAKPGGAFVVPNVIDNWVGLECVAHGGSPTLSIMIGWEE